jgi:ELWxxDGT repeat protein
MPYLSYEGRLEGTVSGGLAFFSGTVGDDVEPWVTDGTPAGTRRLLEICRDGRCGSYPTFGPVAQGQVLFQADRDLWATDGTAAGTRRLGEGIQIPQGVPLPVAAAGSHVVFAGYDKSFPNGGFVAQLKSTQGTLASERVLNLPLNEGLGSNPQGFTALGDDVLFFTCSPSAGGIWKTRGTPETTAALTDAQIACGDGIQPFSFTVLDGVAYFIAIPHGDYWYELWRTDGTREGTRQVTQIGPTKYVSAITRFRGKLLFIAQDLSNDPTLIHSTVWTSDGTAAGTEQLFGIPLRYVASLSAVGDAVYFQGRGTDFIDELYRSDGTAAGTRLLERVGEANPATTGFLEFGGEVYFVGREDDGSVWRTDGTSEGTRKLTPLGNQVRFVLGLAQLGDHLYFLGADLTDPEDYQGVPTLFRSDGTAAGTVRVKTFGSDDSFVTPYPYFPQPQFTAAAGALFFVAYDDEHGGELWRTDGTAAGTVLVTDVNPGPESSGISGLLAAGGRLYFAADDGEHGVELWTSDGTAAGTRRLSDIAAGPSSSSPRELAVTGGRLFFSADDGVIGREPWVLSLPPLDAAFAGKGKP